MKESQFYQYDVVVFVDLHEVPSLLDIGIKEDIEYFISDVFGDGRCILYKEFADENDPAKTKVYEYMLTADEMEYAIFLYNCLAEQSLDTHVEGNDMAQVMEVLMSSFDSLETEVAYGDEFSNYSSHDFKVGDLVYFDEVSRIDGFNLARLEVGELYEIVELDEYTNAPVIKSKIGDFGLYPSEVRYMHKHNDNNSGVNLNEFVDKLLVENKDTLIALAIDEALVDGNFDKVQDIYNTYIK